MRLGGEEQRREVLNKKRNLRDRRVRIFEDWTLEGEENEMEIVGIY